MKKVYQTIIDKGHGNCMQAAIASLLELDLEDVPNFIETHDKFEDTIHGFLLSKGFDCTYISRNSKHNTELLLKVAKFDGGINGFFYATVPSKTYEDSWHAVVVDINLNVVHDPTPNQKAITLTPDDVLGLWITHDIVIGKTGKIFTGEDWDNASEEERELNTYTHKLIES